MAFILAAGAFLQHKLAFLLVRTDIFHDLPLIRLRVTLFQEFLTPAEEKINVNYYKLTVEDYLKMDMNEDTAQIEALKELQKKFSIYFKEVTEDDCV